MSARAPIYQVIEIDERSAQQIEQMGTKPKFWFQRDDESYWLWKAARAGTGEDWAEKAALSSQPV